MATFAMSFIRKQVNNILVGFFLFPAGTFMCTQHIHTLAHAHNLNFKHNQHNTISIDFEYGSQFKAVVCAFLVRDQYNTYSKYTVIRFRERIGAA